MKLSELNRRAQELFPGQDPEIKVVASMGFSDVQEVLSRSDYRDENFFGKEYAKGDWLVIELEREY